MSLRNYVILMIVATLACYLGLGAIIFYTNPFSDGVIALLLFYLSLFISLIGTFAIIGLLVKMIFTRDKLAFRKVTASFRQAIWFSLIISISLYLKKANLLVWKNMLMLVFAFTLIELFIISYKSKNKAKI
jgi:hypothetical protein